LFVHVQSITRTPLLVVAGLVALTVLAPSAAAQTRTPVPTKSGLVRLSTLPPNIQLLLKAALQPKKPVTPSPASARHMTDAQFAAAVKTIPPQKTPEPQVLVLKLKSAPRAETEDTAVAEDEPMLEMAQQGPNVNCFVALTYDPNTVPGQISGTSTVLCFRDVAVTQRQTMPAMDVALQLVNLDSGQAETSTVSCANCSQAEAEISTGVAAVPFDLVTLDSRWYLTAPSGLIFETDQQQANCGFSEDRRQALCGFVGNVSYINQQQQQDPPVCNGVLQMFAIRDPQSTSFAYINSIIHLNASETRTMTAAEQRTVIYNTGARSYVQPPNVQPVSIEADGRSGFLVVHLFVGSTDVSVGVTVRVTLDDGSECLLDAIAPMTAIGATGTPPPLTFTFDSLPHPTPDATLNGQFPSGMIDWGTGNWWLAAPWLDFTTRSVSFNGPSITQANVTFVTAVVPLELDVLNGTQTDSTFSLSCGSNPARTWTIGWGDIIHLTTGWTARCTTMTISSSNGWDTNFDNLKIQS